MQNYKNSRQQALKEKIQRIDKKILREGISSVIQEAINKSELTQINKALKMLQSVPKGISSLDGPIKNVIENLNANVGTEEIQPYISQAMSMAAILKSGFENLQMILENNFEESEFQADNTIILMIGGQDKLYKNIRRQLIMAFTGHKTSASRSWLSRLLWRTGSYTKKRKGWFGYGPFWAGEEYDNPVNIDAEKVVDELMNTPYSVLEKAIKVVK